ncbi:MAG: zf-HC2 domain-containing protein [Vicinamibacterales bacterium]
MTLAVNADCAAILEGISAYIDGELASTECEAIDRHCQTCPSCAAVVAGLRETIGLCRGAAVSELPDAVKRKAQDSIAQLLRTGRL